MPSFERVNNEICTTGLDKTDLPEMLSIEIKAFTTFSFAGSMNSEHDEWLELESVRVNKVAVLSVSR